MEAQRSAAAGRGYHHGDLPQALLVATAEAIDDSGVSSLSLRDVARRAGVSHSAPAHHFGDKAGLLTAFAVQGFERFERALVEGRDASGVDDAAMRFAATGRAYVRFAAAHPAHFDVMFRPDLLRADDPTLQAAADRAYAVLADGVAEAQRAGYAPDADPDALAISAWATAHGLATLWLQGGLAHRHGQRDLDSLLGAVFGHPG